LPEDNPLSNNPASLGTDTVPAINEFFIYLGVNRQPALKSRKNGSFSKATVSDPHIDPELSLEPS
jgi:hypothetical protein